MIMKIKIIKAIRGGHIVSNLSFSTIKPGIYDVDHMNPQGAISIKSEDGKRVGVKPDEFEFLSEMDRYYWIKIAYPNIPSVTKTGIEEPKFDYQNVAINWIITGNVGKSSKTLWVAMFGITFEDERFGDIPYDPDDFSRCYELMKLATPEQLKKALDDVVILCPRWIPYAREWDELVELYEHAKSIGIYSKMYEFMKELENEANSNKGIGGDKGRGSSSELSDL